MKNKITAIWIPVAIISLIARSLEAHPVSVLDKITEHAVAYAQLYSKGYTNFINTISVPSSFLGGIRQSPTAFNMNLVYNATKIQPIADASGMMFWDHPSGLMRLCQCQSSLFTLIFVLLRPAGAAVPVKPVAARNGSEWGLEWVAAAEAGNG
jgi:hypothetical protein